MAKGNFSVVISKKKKKKKEKLVEKEVKSVTERVFFFFFFWCVCLFPFHQSSAQFRSIFFFFSPFATLSPCVTRQTTSMGGSLASFRPCAFTLFSGSSTSPGRRRWAHFLTLLTTYFHHYTTSARLLLDAETASTTTRLISCDPEKRNRATLREWHCVARPCTTHTHTQQHLAIRKKWINFLFVVSCKQGSKKKKKLKSSYIMPRVLKESVIYACERP